MTANGRFDRCLALVLAHEGGFVDHPRDPGGATNLGITRAVLAEWRGAEVTADDVRALTEAEAREIYLARYWNVIRGDQLPPGLDLAVFDFAVNSGPRRAARALQRVLNVEQDGVIGRVTLSAARAADRAEAIDALCELRLAFLRGLDTWSTFGRGWQRRVEAVRSAAQAMAREGLPILEAARTDTVKASAATAVTVAGVAALIQELAPAIETLLPLVDRIGPSAWIALAAALALGGVIAWRRRRA